MQPAEGTTTSTAIGPPTDADYELIELIFFAYREFVNEPDRLLARYNFGRAHHRVLHFVNRRPGLTIAALLDILGITKQSLARVLKDLVDGGYISQTSGRDDRRQRLLHVTGKGLALAEELASHQASRIRSALAGMEGDDRETVRRFLSGLIDPGQAEFPAAGDVLRAGASQTRDAAE